MAGRREVQALAFPNKEIDAEIGLELAHPRGDVRLHAMELLGGARVTPPACTTERKIWRSARSIASLSASIDLKLEMINDHYYSFYVICRRGRKGRVHDFDPMENAMREPDTTCRNS